MDQSTLITKTNQNLMRNVRLAKVVINCSVGESGIRLEKASKVLESLTGQRPQLRTAKKTVRAFGIHKGQEIAVMVTLRKTRAHEFLGKALKAINNTVPLTSFDQRGNVSFGIKEHLDIPGTRYDPELGIIGMDVSINFERAGFRVSDRRRKRAKVGKSHWVTREEAIDFLQKNFDVQMTGAVS